MHTCQHYYRNQLKAGFILPFLLLSLIACTTNPSASSPSPTPQPPTISPTTYVPSPPPVPETCQPTQTALSKGTFLEAQGKATNAELWALFFADPQSIHVSQEVKIVWRMTGSGGFQVVARHAGDVQIKPIWGPEGHGGSNWKRPGDEWGTGFKFPSSGCWNLHATRTNSAGDVWIMVH